jgi:hypothetical protein
MAHEARAAAAGERLAEQAAVRDCPARIDGEARRQRAARLHGAIDVASGIVAEARRIEAGELQPGFEAQRLAEAQAAAAGNLAPLGGSAQAANFNHVAGAYRFRGEADAVLRKRALRQLRLLRGDDGQRAAQTRLPQCAVHGAQVEAGGAQLEPRPPRGELRFAAQRAGTGDAQLAQRERGEVGGKA